MWPFHVYCDDYSALTVDDILAYVKAVGDPLNCAASYPEAPLVLAAGVGWMPAHVAIRGNAVMLPGKPNHVGDPYFQRYGRAIRDYGDCRALGGIRWRDTFYPLDT